MNNFALAKAFGVVAIGRNEGDRLRRCLESALAANPAVVYVDSGSQDDSVNMARALGVEVVELDMSVPFTAARARNEGYARLCKVVNDLEYVQFVDGDCEIVPGWLEKAQAFLEEHEEIAVVCGRCRERYPQQSIYNMLCDIERDTPVGLAKACGGDAMMRADAFDAVDGFRSDLIAGEEPELCVRLRQQGWRIWRLDAEMTLHDAAMLRFSQWWKRSVRGGFAFAQGAFLHGKPPERHWVKETRRAVFWGIGYPAVVACALLIWGSVAVGLLLAYPLQMLRLALRNEHPNSVKWVVALFMVLVKFPEAGGVAKFHFGRIFRKESSLIEYK